MLAQSQHQPGKTSLSPVRESLKSRAYSQKGSSHRNDDINRDGSPDDSRKGFELCPITSAATRVRLRNADSVVTTRSETLGTKEVLAPGGVRT